MAVIVGAMIALGVSVYDFRDGEDFSVKVIPGQSYGIAVHFAETFGVSCAGLKKIGIERGFKDASYISASTWDGSLCMFSEVEESTYGVKAQNSKYISTVFLGSGDKKAATRKTVNTMVAQLIIIVKEVDNQGGVINGIYAHRDIQLPGHGTACPGAVAYAQLVLDGFYSHIKVNGVMVQNPNFKEGIFKDSDLMDVFLKKGVIK